MSCPDKAEGVPQSTSQADSPQQPLIATPFTINSNPQVELLLSLTPTFITVSGDSPTTFPPLTTIPLDAQTAYRINILKAQQTQNFLWFLQILTPDRKIKLQSSNLAHAAAWERELNRRISKFGFWDDFKPIRRISKGISSAVYEVVRVKDHRRFAVKAFAKGTLEQSPEIAKGLESEIRLLRQIKAMHHPHLLGIEQVYLSESSIYLVMQLCGKDLVHGFSHVPLSHEAKVRQIMKQLIQGLQALHHRGVVHRDIKPNNIMFRLGEKLELVITDFGLSMELGKGHPFGRCGTPGFIASEVFALKDEERVGDCACDMFSIGAVFHLLLTGQLLFAAPSSKEVFLKNSKMDFDLTHERYHNISPCSMNLMKMMLTADPSQRITAKQALKHQYFLDLQDKLRSPAPTFQSASHLQFINDQQFSEIDLGAAGRKRLKGEYRKASQL